MNVILNLSEIFVQISNMYDLYGCRYHENIYPELLLPGQAASEANKKLNEKVSIVQFYFLTMTYQIHKKLNEKVSIVKFYVLNMTH